MTMSLSNLLGIPIFRSKCDSAPPPPPPLPPLTAGSSGGGGGGIISTTESAIVDTTSAAASNKLPPPPPPPATATTASTNTTTSATPSSSEQLDASIAQIASSVTSIPNPGPLEASTWDVRRLTSLDTYDGMRCDISKQLSPYFAVVHSFQLGTSGLPEGKNSNYCMTSQMNDENGFMMCRVDPDRQSVDGRIHHALLGGLAMGKLQVGTSTEGQHDQLLGELDFGGMTWTGNIKYGSMGGGNVYGFNYFQGVTPRLALGGEAMYVGVNGNKIGSYTAKYALYPDGKKEEEGGSLLLAGASAAAGGGVPPGEAPSYLAATYNSGQSMLSLAYKRCVTPNNRVTLATSLECSPMTLESQVFVGAEFNLTRSKMNICVDGSGRIQSVLGANLGREPGSPTLNFVAELDHGKSFMKFGYGLNIGS